MKRSIHIVLVIIIFLTFQKEAFMQESVKVVTRKTEKTFTFNSKYGQLIIEAEKGNISIQSWDKDEVHVELSISAKNANAEIASRELEYIHYNLVKDRGNIFLNNKIVLPDTKNELSGVLSARYDIKVPEGTYIKVNNKFGRITVKDINADVISGDLRYCDMLLTNTKGIVNLSISVGDFSSLQSELKGTITSRHSNIVLDETKGKLSLQTRFGSINLKYGNELMNFTATSYATDILINNRKCQSLDINLKGVDCPLTLTQECFIPDKKLLQTSYKPGNDQSDWILLYTPATAAPKLKITAHFGTITLL